MRPVNESGIKNEFGAHTTTPSQGRGPSRTSVLATENQDRCPLPVSQGQRTLVLDLTHGRQELLPCLIKLALLLRLQ